MHKQKAIQIIKDAPVGWEYFATSNERFYKNASGQWFFFNCSHWVECEKLTPLYSARASMIPKSEILKIAESDPLKNAGDNLVLGCEDSKCDEWPCVGSKAQTSDGVGIVELLPDTKGYYVVSVDGEYYQYQIDELSKPKTPKEELRELLCLLWKENNRDFEMFLDVAVKHITKKPQ